MSIDREDYDEAEASVRVDLLEDYNDDEEDAEDEIDSEYENYIPEQVYVFVNETSLASIEISEFHTGLAFINTHAEYQDKYSYMLNYLEEHKMNEHRNFKINLDKMFDSFNDVEREAFYLDLLSASQIANALHLHWLRSNAHKGRISVHVDNEDSFSPYYIEVRVCAELLCIVSHVVLENAALMFSSKNVFEDRTHVTNFL